MKFYKYQGTGNDFIMIDNRNNSFSDTQKKDKDFIERLCHRRFGIGADGLILIEKSKEPNEKADFEMVYFNSDGALGSMCGNGGRCAVAFAYRLGVFEGKETTFLAYDGLHFAKVASKENEVTEVELQMSDISEVETNQDFYFLDTGSPHFVRFLEGETLHNFKNYPVFEEGKKVRYNERFEKEGTNVNFVVKKVANSEKNSIFVRTYERGVEDETLSCGTGVTACALSYSLHSEMLEGAISSQKNQNLINVETLGGNLKVRFDYKKISNSEHNFTNIFLIGAATAVFEGEM
ncbi:diaminopimelate epimerase [Bernardetia sp.]|uniref:diaminopimelate epimerase n=1 Tax=Bernardetia sp. TaxID=1937974 RepID=UPI0025B8FF3E|nr:diaminopimelate epimerase [Bernardetia sp.]